MNQPTTLGLDLGMGAMKLFDGAGGVQLPAFVAIGGTAPVRRTLGLAAAKPALHITVGTNPTSSACTPTTRAAPSRTWTTSG